MKMQHTVSYEAEPAAVFAVLIDPAYVQDKCTATGAVDSHVEVTREGHEVVIHTVRTLPADVPAIAKKFVGDTITIDQTERWGPANVQGLRAGTLDATFPGTPMKVTATMTLAPGGPGAELHLAGEVSAGIPFVGGSIEGFAADQLRRGLDREAAVAAERL